MKILAFHGSPRRHGNSSLLLKEYIRGANEAGADVEEIIASDVNLNYCQGCLRCNILKYCAIKNDDWPQLSQKILEADILIFATPIYFHHVTAPLKKIIDRFRSFIHVQITEQGLCHTPWHNWRKQFVIISCLGSSVTNDAEPVQNLFEFIRKELGDANELISVIGTRLAVNNQVMMKEDELAKLYPKLKLPQHLVEKDFIRNQNLLKKCYELGRKIKA